MIAKLRDECGPAFTQKMEDLLQELVCFTQSVLLTVYICVIISALECF